MASFFGLGKTRKPRQFDYKPRFYDPEAEEKEQRRKAILGEDSDGEYRPGMYIREKRLLRMQEQRNRDRARQSRTTLMRGVIFVLLALGMLYLMFNYLGKAF